jgi:hypothetical protein
VSSELRNHVNDARESLLLPFATIIETGNHIAHLSDGRLRRYHSEKFAEITHDGIVGEAPWQATQLPDYEEVKVWLSRFPDHVATGVGFADLSIISEWEKRCRLHPNFRVLIWSLDFHLSSYDKRP